MYSKYTVHIVAETIGPRLHYACEVVFNRLLRHSYKITSFSDYLQVEGPVLYYLPQKRWEEIKKTSNENSLHMVPHGLLTHTGTGDVDLNSLDVLSAIFWLVTHYASYNPTHPRDKYGRALPALLPQYPDATNPTCHILALCIAQALGIDKELTIPLTVRHTFDIDNAFAYQAKGPKRWLGSLAKEILAGGAKAVTRRLKHALGTIADPYDNHALIMSMMEGRAYNVFFLMSDKGRYDRAIHPSHPDFQRIVRAYRDSGASIGLHPSYAGGQNTESFSVERALLETMLEKPIDTTRYHYLRFLIPDTPRLLIKAGIKADFSPGPVQEGFWQGISTSIPWYDVEADSMTDLELKPAAWMDVHHTQNSDEGLLKLKEMYSKLQPYGGELILIWHNDYFSQFAQAKEFSDVLSW